MRRLPVSALLTLLALAACLETDPIPEANYGVIGLATVVSAANDTILSPEAQFFRTGLLSLPTSRVDDDQCQRAAFPVPDQVGGLPRFLDAGDSVAISTAASTKYLFPVVGVGGGERYALRDSVFPFHPGENVTVTVPGAAGGFANGTISVLTARGFTLGQIAPSPPAGEGIDLTWTPAGDDGTKMLMSLQYGVGQIEANEQIFCSLVDDGAAEVPSTLVAQWRDATTGSRRVAAARWRVAFREVTGGVLVVVSAFEIEAAVD
jgi:hypothetical protein